MKIYVFANGAALVDENNPNEIKIDGEEPIEILEATEENIREYFTQEEVEATSVEVQNDTIILQG